MTRTALFLLLSFHALADEPELWLVELEHNDGIRLQFQGAELELGSAALAGVRVSRPQTRHEARPAGGRWRATEHIAFWPPELRWPISPGSGAPCSP
ncbi:hypothetical protein ACF2JD_19300 [Aeromonas sp. A-5]|uniref:hypothetical protein n=1 Tax=Aeromonas ichthyocola TaxID=3367746 RepID=UPI0038D694DB